MQNNQTVLLRDTVHQTSRGESAVPGLTTGQPRPLTAWVMSASSDLTAPFFVSKLQNSINIYPGFWHRLTSLIQYFKNS